MIKQREGKVSILSKHLPAQETLTLKKLENFVNNCDNNEKR